MVKRKLPSASQRNPQLTPEHTPLHEILVERRRLGQTDLKAPGSSPGEASKTIGIFDYAHLRVPLPSDLGKSGIFTPLKNGAYPESYFLMRRSKDGYISATGLYKAAYPYSTNPEEQSERTYHKALPSGKGEEVAGNIWVSPEDALQLADDYSIRPWIVALLDNEKIEIGSKEKAVTKIASPPSFDMPPKSSKLAPPAELNASAAATPRARSKRSASPAKISATPRKIASPRKRRAASAKPDEPAEKSPKTARKPSKAQQEKLTNGTSEPPKEATTPTVAETVRVEVNETVETADNGKEVSHTTVSVSMPASHPDLPLPEDTTAMIEKAKQMVEEANKLEKRVTKNAKRKASSSLTKGDVEGAVVLAAKKPRTELQEKLVTERVRTRALVGLTATLIVGAIVPYFL